MDDVPIHRGVWRGVVPHDALLALARLPVCALLGIVALEAMGERSGAVSPLPASLDARGSLPLYPRWSWL